MGKRGPRKKSVYLEALEGFPGKEGLQEFGIEAQGAPFIPEHLSDDARGCIEMIMRSMPEKVYSALDSYLLAAFGTAWALHKMAAHKINEPGFKVCHEVGGRAVSYSTWVTVLGKQAMLMASLGDRLGLDPASRAALKLPGAKQQKSQFAGLLGQTALLSSSRSSPSLLE
jgi:P27 family predicted phage terminase small subunit